MRPMSRTSGEKPRSAVRGTTRQLLRSREGTVALIFLSPLLMSCVSCSRGNARADSPASLPLPLVSVVEATAQDVPRYLDEIGRNTAFESVSVTPQVAGRVTERHFQDGENLKKGQLLFVIDPRPFKAQLDSAQANLAQAKAALELAKIQFARDQELVGTRAISKQDYDTKKNAVDVIEAQVEAAKAAIETAQINLGLLLHSLAHRRPRRRAPGGCRQCRAGQHDLAPLYPAAGSNLRKLHHHRTRSSSRCKRR